MERNQIFIKAVGILAILALATILVIGFVKVNRIKALAGKQATSKAAIQFAKLFNPSSKASACIELSTGRNKGESDRDYYVRVTEVAILLQQDGCTNVALHLSESGHGKPTFMVTAEREVYIRDQ